MRWPIARTEVLAVRDHLLHDMVHLARAEGAPDDADAAVLDLVIHYFLLEAMLAYQANALARRADLDGTPFWTAAIRGQSTDSTAPVLRRFREGVARPARWRTPPRILRGLMQRGPVRRPPLSRIDQKRDIVAVATGGLLDRHAMASADPVSYCPLWYWFSRPLPSSGLRHVRASLIDGAMTAVEDAFRTGGETASPVILHNLDQLLRDMTASFHGRIVQVERQRKRLPNRLWLGSAGLPAVRALAEAVRRAGGQTTGHDHGTSSGCVELIVQTLVDLKVADTFVTFTPGMADGLRNNLKAELLTNGRSSRIIAVPDHNAGRSAVPEPTPNRNGTVIRRVMYVSTLYNGENIQLTPLLPDPIAVDWQTRLFARLRDFGYQTLHKPHPGSPIPPPEQFERVCGAQTCQKPFNAAIEEADLLVFDYPMTTTFRDALASDKPVVLIDLDIVRFQTTARKLLERRCRIVSAEYDSAGRVKIDWNALHSAIGEAATLGDRTYYRTFYGEPVGQSVH